MRICPFSRAWTAPPTDPLIAYVLSLSTKPCPLDAQNFAEIEKKFAKEFEPRGDVAAEIAHAVFTRNADTIYQAMSKALLRGDPRVFQALSNRGYGLPQQELAFAQEKSFKLIIEYIGDNRQEEIGPQPTIDGEELPHGGRAPIDE